MEDIIVTGATGFIGRRLIRELIKVYSRENILCLIRDKTDDLEISGRKILSELKIKTKLIDLVTGAGLNNLPQNPKLIFHLAASTESGDKDHRCNDEGTLNLLNAFKNSGSDTKFIFTSTSAIFSGRKDTSAPIDKHTKPSPSNEYGRTKLKAEEILKAHSGKTGMKCIVFRLSTVWGEGTRENGLFDKMNKLVIKRSFIPRLNWKGETGLIFVNDVVNILILTAKKNTQKDFSKHILCHENLTLSRISEVIHKKNNIEYRKIVLPDKVWDLIEFIVKRSAKFEKVLPGTIYNLFWRLNLIVTDSLKCKKDECIEEYPEVISKMTDFADNYK